MRAPDRKKNRSFEIEIAGEIANMSGHQNLERRPRVSYAAIAAPS
jgi:hypothetical protein